MLFLKLIYYTFKFTAIVQGNILYRALFLSNIDLFIDGFCIKCVDERKMSFFLQFVSEFELETKSSWILKPETETMIVTVLVTIIIFFSRNRDPFLNIIVEQTV